MDTTNLTAELASPAHKRHQTLSLCEQPEALPAHSAFPVTHGRQKAASWIFAQSAGEELLMTICKAGAKSQTTQRAPSAQLLIVGRPVSAKLGSMSKESVQNMSE